MKYKIYIHTQKNDIYYGATSVKEQKETVVKKLLERGKDVKIIVIINNNQIYDSVIFSENNP